MRKEDINMKEIQDKFIEHYSVIYSKKIDNLNEQIVNCERFIDVLSFFDIENCYLEIQVYGYKIH